MENKQQVVIGVEALKKEVELKINTMLNTLAGSLFLDEVSATAAGAQTILLKALRIAVCSIRAEDFPPPARHSTNVVQGILQIIDDKLVENTDLQFRYPEAGQTLTAEMWTMRGLRDQIKKLLDDAAPDVKKPKPAPRFHVRETFRYFELWDIEDDRGFLHRFTKRAVAQKLCDLLNREDK